MGRRVRHRQLPGSRSARLGRPCAAGGALLSRVHTVGARRTSSRCRQHDGRPILNWSVTVSGSHSVADYLGQLVQRVRQPDNAIQPRLSSRFEPPRQARVEVPTVSMPVEDEPLFAPADTPIDGITESQSSQVLRRPRKRGREAGAPSVDLGASVDQQPPEEPADSYEATRRKGARIHPEDATQSRGRGRSTCLFRRRIRARCSHHRDRQRQASGRIARGRSVQRRCRGLPSLSSKWRHRSRSQPTASRTGARRTIRHFTNRSRKKTIGAAQSDGLKRRWHRGRSSKWYRTSGSRRCDLQLRDPLNCLTRSDRTGPDAPTIHVTIGRVEIQRPSLRPCRASHRYGHRR